MEWKYVDIASEAAERFEDAFRNLGFDVQTDERGLKIRTTGDWHPFMSYTVKEPGKTDYSRLFADLDPRLFQLSEVPACPYGRARDWVASLAHEPLAPKDITNFKYATAFCPFDSLPKLFREAVEPVFFGTFPNGELHVVKTNPAFWRLSAATRIGHVVTLYPEMLEDKPMHTMAMSRWLHVEAMHFATRAFAIGSAILPPYLSGIVAQYAPAAHFIFIPDQGIKMEIAPSGTDWRDLVRPSGIGGEKFDALDEHDERHVWGKAAFDESPTADELGDFWCWLEERIGAMVGRLMDPTRFVQQSNPDTIDFNFAFDAQMTIMHVLDSVQRICCSTDCYANKTEVFRIADMLSAVAKATGHRRDDVYFRELFSMKKGASWVKNALGASEVPLLVAYSEKVEEAYRDLRTTLTDSIWYRKKVHDGIVEIKSRDLKKINKLSEDEFVGYAIRALRNTHHGYFLRNDRSARPARFLALISGELPDNLPTIAVGWALALLQDLGLMVGLP